MVDRHTTVKICRVMATLILLLLTVSLGEAGSVRTQIVSEPPSRSDIGSMLSSFSRELALDVPQSEKSGLVPTVPKISGFATNQHKYGPAMGNYQTGVHLLRLVMALNDADSTKCLEQIGVLEGIEATEVVKAEIDSLKTSLENGGVSSSMRKNFDQAVESNLLKNNLFAKLGLWAEAANAAARVSKVSFLQQNRQFRDEANKLRMAQLSKEVQHNVEAIVYITQQKNITSDDLKVVVALVDKFNYLLD